MQEVTVVGGKRRRWGSSSSEDRALRFPPSPTSARSSPCSSVVRQVLFRRNGFEDPALADDVNEGLPDVEVLAL